MKFLNKNWIIEGTIDFEYKKYILLAYLKEVKENFSNKKLYPFLSDLISHYKNLVSIRENKKLMYENFPDKMTRTDFENLSFIYEKIVEDDDMMEQIEEILSYAIPKVDQHLREGKDIYEYIEENLNIYTIGIYPLFPDEGYFFIIQSGDKTTKVFEFQITIFQNSGERFRGIHTKYIDSFKKSITNTYQSIKIELIKRYKKKLPNPATYVIESAIPCPFDETLLPIAKRSLVKYISVASGKA